MSDNQECSVVHFVTKRNYSEIIFKMAILILMNSCFKTVFIIVNIYYNLCTYITVFFCIKKILRLFFIENKENVKSVRNHSK